MKPRQYFESDFFLTPWRPAVKYLPPSLLATKIPSFADKLAQKIMLPYFTTMKNAAKRIDLDGNRISYRSLKIQIYRITEE